MDNLEAAPTPIMDGLRASLQERLELGGEPITTTEGVEQHALEVLDTIPYAQELMTEIRDARSHGKENARAVKERAKLLREVSIEISLITGVEIEAAEHENQRLVYKEQLATRLADITPETSDEDIMLKLGMIRKVEGKQGHVFTFPSRLFPPYIKEQWDVYIGMVGQFDAAHNKLEQGLITQQDFDGIDMLRKKAHDTVSGSIGEMLEFPGWDLDNYRRLAGKMRDEKFAKPMGEMADYARIFRDEYSTGEHLTNIHRHLGSKALGQASRLETDQ